LKPLVSVIVINWNGLKDTIECLESLRKLEYDNYEIIVVDNNSSDDSVSTIKKMFTEVKLIVLNKNVGYSGGCYIGANKSKGQYLLLLNNDTTVHPKILNVLVKIAEKDQKFGIVAPKIMYYDQDKIWFGGGKILKPISSVIHMNRWGMWDNSKPKNNIQEVSFIPGCVMLIKRELINKIGIFDPYYFFNLEDMDLCYRTSQAGYKCIYVPISMVYHKDSSSSREKEKRGLSRLQAYFEGRNSSIFALTYSNKANIYIITIALILRFLLYSTHMVLTRRLGSILSYWKGIHDGIQDYSFSRKKKGNLLISSSHISF